MVVFPNAKINIGLNIINKREDGYHNLETIFYPINICDAIEVVVNADNSNDIVFSSSGLIVDVNDENNLCVKAYKLLKKDYQLPNIKLHLHKIVPMGAGLGGGSADAAFVLTLLNTKFQLGISQQQLLDYSLQLGSDCPFFIINKPCFATSRGEELQEIDLDLSNYKIVIVNPGIHISTAQAFANITPQQPKVSVKEIVQKPINDWKNLLVNDFEQSVFKTYPSLSDIKNKLYDSGALYASMSGTGSTFYGFFDKTYPETNIQFNDNYWVKWV